MTAAVGAAAAGAGSEVRTLTPQRDSGPQVGTLVVEVFDARTKTVIRRGTASKTLSDNPRKNADRLNKAVNTDVQEVSSWFEKDELMFLRAHTHTLFDSTHRRRRGRVTVCTSTHA